MEKFKFVAEYELRASPKVLFPYLSSAAGLSQWFCEKVNNLPDQKFDFYWDNEKHVAKQTAMRLNKNVKFEFLNGDEKGGENSYVEFKLDVSKFSNSTYLKVTEYSANTDETEQRDLWLGLMDGLREIVGS